MREANWDELFHKRDARSAPRESRLSDVVPWEDWLTFGIVAVIFMSVVHSVDSANWVDDMPSLYPLGFSALIASYLLSRVRFVPVLLLLGGFLLGATLVYLQALAILPGATPAARTDEMLDRMYAWWSAATQGGISSDQLPFILITLVLMWFGAFISGWAIFRWRNPWLGLVPGGVALMWNISFIPGQFSYAFVTFVFGAVLLLMRMHVAARQQEWDERNVEYPEFISLAVLNATFWVSIILLLVASYLPLAQRSDSANERWSSFTAPITDRVTPLARVFVGVNAQKAIDVHNIEDALAFQGKIALSNADAVQVDVTITPEIAAFLRAQSFDRYTSEGWKADSDARVPLDSGERTDVPQSDTTGARQEVTVNIKVEGNNDDFLYSLGQPVASDRQGEAVLGADSTDITSLRPGERLNEGDTYTVTGSVSAATPDQLRAAGTDYPAWAVDRYTRLPRSLPRRVERKASEVAGNATTPYDTAVAIERYLRTFPNDFNVPETPPGRDSVDYFLFDVQRGYFDYHASAMAVMLRTLGVPARVSVGYVIDPLRKEGDTTNYKLSERNAFAWTEVYFPGIGWVEFNPTPAQPSVRRPGETPENPPASAGTRDPNLAPEPDIDLGADGGANLQPVQDEGSGGSSAGPVLLALLIAGGVIALLAAGGRFAWEFGLGSMPRPAQLWEKTQRLAAWGKHGARPSETPREFASRLANETPEAQDIGYLAAAYERSRFGQKALSEDETERLESAWVSVRNGLLRQALRLRRRRAE